MKVTWDYTHLADAYLSRPDYAPEAIDALLALAGVAAGALVCDVGAGVGHMTLPLLERGLVVKAVEPNDAMRANGQRRTAGRAGVTWHEGTGEATGQPDAAFDLVTFGSSFNVCDRAAALVETARILKPGGWFACAWNHRDLDDPVQARVEALIAAAVPSYDYGTRREDQTAIIDASRLYGPVHAIEGAIRHRVVRDAWVEAWRSHATLARQAGDRHEQVVAAIARLLEELGLDEIEVPYVTRIWSARLDA